MPREIVTLSLGQCGNQIAWRFWDLCLREHAARSPPGVFDESMGTFFSNVDTGGAIGARRHLSSGAEPLRGLRARAILIDTEEGVVNQLLRSPLGGLFDRSTQVVTDVSGAGNNWAHGYSVYGPHYRDALRSHISRCLEQCDSPQSFFMLNSLGGGTGSGVGSFVLELLADEQPEMFRFCAPVFPSEDDDVITSPYNHVLALNKLIDDADCVLPLQNSALLDIVNLVDAATAGGGGGSSRHMHGSGGVGIAPAVAATSVTYVPAPPTNAAKMLFSTPWGSSGMGTGLSRVRRMNHTDDDDGCSDGDDDGDRDESGGRVRDTHGEDDTDVAFRVPTRSSVTVDVDRSDTRAARDTCPPASAATIASASLALSLQDADAALALARALQVAQIQPAESVTGASSEGSTVQKGGPPIKTHKANAGVASILPGVSRHARGSVVTSAGGIEGSKRGGRSNSAAPSSVKTRGRPNPPAQTLVRAALSARASGPVASRGAQGAKGRATPVGTDARTKVVAATQTPTAAMRPVSAAAAASAVSSVPAQAAKALASIITTPSTNADGVVHADALASAGSYDQAPRNVAGVARTKALANDRVEAPSISVPAPSTHAYAPIVRKGSAFDSMNNVAAHLVSPQVYCLPQPRPPPLATRCIHRFS